LDQLEGLVVNWSPVGLAALRSRIAVAIIDRENQNPDAEADAYRTAAVMDTLPNSDFEDGLDVSTDDDALAAAYAALGDMAPGGAPEMQGELGSSSAKALARELTRAAADAPGEIRIHALQP
jgi:hypothetical protein